MGRSGQGQDESWAVRCRCLAPLQLLTGWLATLGGCLLSAVRGQCRCTLAQHLHLEAACPTPRSRRQLLLMLLIRPPPILATPVTAPLPAHSTPCLALRPSHPPTHSCHLLPCLPGPLLQYENLTSSEGMAPALRDVKTFLAIHPKKPSSDLGLFNYRHQRRHVSRGSSSSSSSAWRLCLRHAYAPTGWLAHRALPPHQPFKPSPFIHPFRLCRLLLIAWPCRLTAGK